jgi:hypothetical protein
MLAIGLLVLAATGCEEADESIVIDVGTTRLLLADSDLASQTVEVGLAQHTVQVMWWKEVKTADLDLGGELIDMKFGEPCRFDNTSIVLPRGNGKCAGGVIIDADGETREATLLLETTIWVYRAEPIDLPPTEDFDGDGLPSGADNCPLIDNPDQTDTGMKGFGDACSFFFLGGQALDSDGDTIPDIVDNCAHVPNPGQEDTMGVGHEPFPAGLGDVPDGIGDACNEQKAQVNLGGNPDVSLTLGPIDVLQPFRGNSFLTVDFKDQISLVCDWAAGTCEIDPSQIEMCLDTVGNFGCSL